MIINAELDTNQTVIKKSALSAFPDKQDNVRAYRHF
jgi:hypothetical protein